MRFELFSISDDFPRSCLASLRV